MSTPNKKISVGPTLPKGLGENVNHGKSMNDPTAGQTSSPPRYKLGEDGKVYSDAPAPQPQPSREMREVEIADGPNIDPVTGAYLPAVYRIHRVRQKSDGTIVENDSIRIDH